MPVTAAASPVNRNPTQWPDYATKAACLLALLVAEGAGPPAIVDIMERVGNTPSTDWAADKGSRVTGPMTVTTSGTVSTQQVTRWPAYAEKEDFLLDLEGVLGAGGGGRTLLYDVAMRLSNTDTTAWNNAGSHWT